MPAAHRLLPLLQVSEPAVGGHGDDDIVADILAVTKSANSHTTIVFADHRLDVPVERQICRHLRIKRRRPKDAPKADLPKALSPSRSYARNTGGKSLVGTCREAPATADRSRASLP